MKKLGDIEKKNIFEVPDGYFDRLALQIQSRTEILKPADPILRWRLAFRYAIPVIVIGVFLFFIFKPKAPSNVSDLLAAVPTEHLIAYLHESDISEHELLEALQLTNLNADSLNLPEEGNFTEDINESELKSVLENEL